MENTYVVKEDEKSRKIYKSVESETSKLKFLGSEISKKILNELAKRPMCAMDIARQLKVDEQKIYYHIRNLEKIGLIEVVKKEFRIGALAKIYKLKAPYLSVKVAEGEPITDKHFRVKELEFLNPFIKNGKENFLIVVGSPDPHGRFGTQASDGYAAIDLALFLGSFLKNPSMNYKLDTHIREKDFDKNLILIGGPKNNILVDKINKKLPIFFDEKNEWLIISSLTNKIYKDDEIGVVIKIPSPFNKKRWVMILSGRRFKGTRSSIIAVVKYSKNIMIGNKCKKGVARVVKGIDRDSDGIIDDVEFLE